MQAHLDIMKFGLHQLARGEQRASPALPSTCNAPGEPAQPHQLRDPARVVAGAVLF